MECNGFDLWSVDHDDHRYWFHLDHVEQYSCTLSFIGSGISRLYLKVGRSFFFPFSILNAGRIREGTHEIQKVENIVEKSS